MWGCSCTSLLMASSTSSRKDGFSRRQVLLALPSPRWQEKSTSGVGCGVGGGVLATGGGELAPPGGSGVSLPPHIDNDDASTTTASPAIRRVPNFIRASPVPTPRGRILRA